LVASKGSAAATAPYMSPAQCFSPEGEYMAACMPVPTLATASANSHS
jgi:hypothetical protein